MLMLKKEKSTDCHPELERTDAFNWGRMPNNISILMCCKKKCVCRVNMPIEIIVGALSCIYSVCFGDSKSCWTGPRVTDHYSTDDA